jgi:predicted RNA-binding Zn-ribbon protein involved in translation (DUF1610 family)
MNTDGTYIEWECPHCGADNEMDENDAPLPCRDCGKPPYGPVQKLV